MSVLATDDFEQLQLRFTDPIQFDYEVIRPILLFAEHIHTRSEQTNVDRRVVGEKARRFAQHGMLGLIDQRGGKAGRKPHVFPDPIAAYVLYVKHLYPPIRYRELVRIVARKFGYHTNHHTVKRFLDAHPILVQLPLAWTTYHQFEDAYQARWTIVRMFYEGWQQQRIAGCLKLSERHVRRVLAQFAKDDFASLEDQRHRPVDHPANQLTLPFLREMLAVQHAHPRAGKFRIRGLLEQQRVQEPPSVATVGRAMAVNRAHHGAPPAWASDRPADTDHELKVMPFQPQHRHQYWFIDLRYLRQFDGRWVYSICVIEGYSRKIIAGMASEYQDEVAVLQLLTAALTEYGCPTAIVSDNGSVFTAQAYGHLLDTLDIEACSIEKGKPWENVIEAQFKVQLRLADALGERATTFAELQQQHAAFVETFNTTAHWAHRDRTDGLRTPADVLAWSRGRTVTPDDLRQAVRHLEFTRAVDQRGYVSIQRFYLYAERGLARQRVSIWLYEGRLDIAYQQALLARYQYRANRLPTDLQRVEQPRLYPTAYRSPQLERWELDETQWRNVVERPIRHRRSKQGASPWAEQLPIDIAWALVLLVAASARFG